MGNTQSDQRSRAAVAPGLYAALGGVVVLFLAWSMWPSSGQREPAASFNGPRNPYSQPDWGAATTPPPGYAPTRTVTTQPKAVPPTEVKPQSTPSPSETVSAVAVSLTPQPMSNATAKPAEPEPPPKVIHDNAYRAKLWASLPPPQAPASLPLEPLPEEDARALRRELAQELLRKAGVRKIPRVDVELETPAKFTNCHRQYKEFAPHYQRHARELYFLVGQHLMLADALFAQNNHEVNMSGIGVVTQVIDCLAHFLKDGELAARVADAYLLPKLHLAPLEEYAVLNQRFLMTYAIRACRDSGRDDILERVCGYTIDLYGSNRNSTDAVRVTLAKALKNQNKWDEAILVLKDIQDPSMTSLRDYHLPIFERQRDEYLAAQQSAAKQQ